MQQLFIEQKFVAPNGVRLSQLVALSRIGYHPPEWRDCKLEKFAWPAYAWPGGYPIFYQTGDHGVLCPVCANLNLPLTLLDDPQWQIVAADVNWEDHHLYCDHCSNKVPSAYGEE